MKRYQIDYIIVKKRYRKQIKSSLTYPGFDVDSNHILVMAKYSISFKKHKRGMPHKWCLQKLKEREIFNELKEMINKMVADKGNCEEVKESVKTATQKILGK